jgi:CHAT domain-containing protein
MPSPAAFELNRLPGSGAEIRQISRVWGDSTVLEGPGARRSAFLAAVAAPSAVIHLATHVLADPSHRDQAFVAFGLGEDSRPELLAASEVAFLRVPGSLVVMTGCSTGVGASAGSAGLLGLSRAWMVAGATGVVATGWPMEDRGGSLLAGFYRRLKSTGAAEALQPAEALQQVQVEMLHSGTWQSAPVHWAAYQLTGGVR